LHGIEHSLDFILCLATHTPGHVGDEVIPIVAEASVHPLHIGVLAVGVRGRPFETGPGSLRIEVEVGLSE